MMYLKPLTDIWVSAVILATLQPLNTRMAATEPSRIEAPNNTVSRGILPTRRPLLPSNHSDKKPRCNRTASLTLGHRYDQSERSSPSGETYTDQHREEKVTTVDPSNKSLLSKVDAVGAIPRSLHPTSGVFRENLNAVDLRSLRVDNSPPTMNTITNPNTQSPDKNDSRQPTRIPHLNEMPTSESTPESTNNNDDESSNHEKTHLRLGEDDMMNCFGRTRQRPLDEFRFASPNSKFKFYEELKARSGSVVSETDLFRNGLQNSNLTCRYEVTYDRDVYCCALRVLVPQDSYVAVTIVSFVGLLFYLSDSKNAAYVDNSEDDVKRLTVLAPLSWAFMSDSNVANIILVVSVDASYPGRTRFHLRFQTLQHPGLQVKLTSSNRGFVQSPMFHPRAVSVNTLPSPWAYVHVPADHEVMISSAIPFETFMECLVLYAADRANETLDTFCNYYTGPRAIIYNTSSLLFHTTQMMSQSTAKLRTMKIHFSFHNRSAAPVTVANSTLWNCSVPYRSDFLHHLSCNLGVDCNDASDESDCEYTSEACGPRYISLGGACVVYLRPNKKLSWNKASDVCSKGGTILASLSTVDKWNDAVRLLPDVPFRVLRYYLGVKYSAYNIQGWYKFLYKWTDGTTLFHTYRDTGISVGTCERNCGILEMKAFEFGKTGSLNLKSGCQVKHQGGILCEKETFSITPTKYILLNDTGPPWPTDINALYVKCPHGRHYVHEFLACDVKTSCWSRDEISTCESTLTRQLPTFACGNGMEQVSYTLVCDLRKDCTDGSDENFCVIPPCDPAEFECKNKQCIPMTKMCDVWRDCPAAEEENQCSVYHVLKVTYPPPSRITLNDKGRVEVQPMNASTPATAPGNACPQSHFQCLDDGFCLPIFFRCNGVFDCPGREDEANCDTCQGYYRCYESKTCLHYSDLCDGRVHCDRGDDEWICDEACPPHCECHGLAFFCPHAFEASAYPNVRFLDAAGSAMTPAQLAGSQWLTSLILANCGLRHLDGLVLPNLFVLDLRDNRLSNINPVHFERVLNLRELIVAGNPLSFALARGGRSESFGNLVKLDLSRVMLRVFDAAEFTAFSKIKVLNLSQSGVQRIQGEGFRSFGDLRVIDLRECPMTGFTRVMFQDLKFLQFVYAENFKICCPTLLPLGFNVHDCIAPSDEISSCNNLLRGNVYSVFVFVLSALAVVGNSVSFVYRTYVSKQRESKLGYGNFVTHLSVSDLFMGIYLTVIGAADQVYHGAYVWKDEAWRHSAVCKFAGFLSLLSSEVSALIMCLITIDRFIVLRFPFSGIHFSPSSAHVASAIVWALGVLLASVPLLPATSHWEFYSQTGICIPLPITKTDFAGHGYSFSILVVFNFIVFVCISLGQLSIYWSVRANSMSICSTTKKSKDLTIARRLITVAMTDFLCWFPIGVLGLLAYKGFPIPGEVNVIVAIFVLPLNSAINPCLYTVNVIVERRSRAREEKLRAFLLAQVKAQN